MGAVATWQGTLNCQDAHAIMYMYLVYILHFRLYTQVMKPFYPKRPAIKYCYIIVHNQFAYIIRFHLQLITDTILRNIFLVIVTLTICRPAILKLLIKACVSVLEVFLG